MSNLKRNFLLLSSIKPVFIKEVLQIRRSPLVLAFALVFPLIEMLLLGFFLDINVRRINTVVYDLAKTQESRQVLKDIANTSYFQIVKNVNSDEELNQTIVAGEAKVGIKIPKDFSRHLMEGTTASVLVLVDGSNATLATEAINVSSNVMLQESVKRLLDNREASAPETGNPGLETRAAILYNPEVRSPNFFLPGLIVFVLPSITVILVALSIAGERERGTMEQLTMTPVTSLGLLLGKVLPYGVLGIFQETVIILAIRYVFQVPIHGNPLLLVLLSIPYIFTSLGLGLIVSAHANTNMDAMPFAFLIRIVPPLYLSGYIFPIESMPPAFQSITKLIPERYFMEIVRGIVLRGATIEHFWHQTLILTIMSVVIFSLACFLYRRKDW